MSEKALILFENDLGVKLDIEKDPLSVIVYDLEGNEISGGSDIGITPCKITVINTLNVAAVVPYIYSVKDGAIAKSDQVSYVMVAPSGNVDIDAIYEYSGGDKLVTIYALDVSTVPPTPKTLTSSNAENCTFDADAAPYYYVYLTDNGDSSITLTIS